MAPIAPKMAPKLEPGELEATINQALTDLASTSELKSHLSSLCFTKIREIELKNRKAILIYIPVPQLKSFQKVHIRLVRELEKKFGGQHVLFLADRKILKKQTRKFRGQQKQKRPRSRTLTYVFDHLLYDLVYPAEVVGKRIRYKLNGNVFTRVLLDESQQTTLEYKLDTFVNVYKKLTGKEVTFEFRPF